MSLRLRLSVTLTVVLLATVVVGMSYLMLNVRQAIREELNSSVELSSNLIGLLLRHVPPGNVETLAGQLDTQLAGVGDTRHLRINLINDASTPSIHTELPAPDDVPRWFVRLVHPEPIELVRVVKLGGGPQHILLRADATDEIAESWREVRPLMLMLVVFGVAANGLVYIVLGRSLSSLQNVSRAFLAIKEGEFETIVPLVGVSDIDIIAERFNHMRGVLKQSKYETQTLAQRSLAIQENERRRLALELHDELGQSISAIKALAVAIRDRKPDSDPAVVDSADTIVDVSTEIYARVRNMMAHLRPVVLDELGLVSALQHMVDDWNGHHEDTFCEFRVEMPIPKLSDDVAINCYRIVQEALTNIAKHARADRASVVLRGESGPSGQTGILDIRIDDNGVGFDPNSTDRGLGLVGIHERVEAMQGEMELLTGANHGTHYSINVSYGENRNENDG